MYPSTNILSIPTASIETLDIVPPTPPASPDIKKSDLNNTVNYIHTDIKSDLKANNNNITAINNNTYDILAILVDINKNKSKQ